MLMKLHIRLGLPALLLTAATAVTAQSYPPPQPPYDPGPGAYDDQGDPNQDPYYYDDQAPDGSYQDQGYQDQAYPPDNGAYDNQGPVDESLFYSELSPYGRWIQRGSYGWVWEPTRVPVGWRPYTQGRWVNTDYGWTWVSQEPWGWATYHYGRWMLDPEYGWLWVPGREWGPAWVSFQQGDGYIGWAPLPPSVGFRAGFGIQIGGLNLSASIDPYAYSFVPEREFLRDRVASVILPPARNVTFVHRTRNITDIAVVNNRIVNRSVPVQRIEQVTGQPVRRFRLNETRNPARGRVAQIQGDQVSLFRPGVTLAQPRPNTTPTEVIQRRRQRMQQAQPQQPGQPVPSQAQQQWRQQRQARPAPSTADLERKYQTEQQQLQARQQAERSRLQQMRQTEGSDQQARGRAQDLAAQRQAEERALQQQQQREQQLLQARHQREQQAAQARPQRQNQPQPAQPQPRETKQRKEREQQRAREEQQQQPPPPPV
jgi:hypothetical protein